MSSHRDDTRRPDHDEDVRLDRATGDGDPRDAGHEHTEEERAAAALQSALAPRETLPPALRDRLLAEGQALVGAGRAGASAPPARGRGAGWLALAACIAIAGVAVSAAVWIVNDRNAQLQDQEALIADLERRIESNDAILAEARSSVERLREAIVLRDDTISEQETRLAEAADHQLQLADQLATATRSLDRARLEIARYEAPVDPATLQANRQKLLEVPGTVRLAWAPFQLPDAPPAEQPGVTGDVVWNDELEQGYLRFTGLAVNDPNIEQYQVWIIDERGLEQKVSGGVFNATAQGEVIVPIEPGIDVGRVALFAVTVEDPGGTWVPDLQRRVVVAPRSDS